MIDNTIAPLTWSRMATQWDFSLGWSLAVLVVGAAYGATAMLARRRGPSRIRAWRMLLFGSGLVVWVLAVQSAITVYSTHLLWMHMVQHLALIMVVPALLILGSPLRATREAAGRTEDLASMRGGVPAVLTHPGIGYLVYTFVLVYTHLTSFLNHIVTNPAVHTGEGVLYLLTGWWFFWPLLGDDPIRWRPHYLLRIGLLLAAMLPDTVIGIVLLQSDHVLAPAVGAGRGWGPTPLRDQQLAGGIMWVFGDGLMMLFIVVLALVYVAHSKTDSSAGDWLEGVRRSTMAERAREHGVDPAVWETGGDVDDDDAVLADYNAMLQRLRERNDRQP